MSELRVTTLKHESATTDNITLDANGNVGIATTSPVEQLTIGGNGPQGRIGFNTTGVDHPYMQMTQYGSPNTNVTVRIDADGNSYFNGGNVGIGTSSPAEKLEVAGAIRLSSYLHVSSGSTGKYFGLGSSITGAYAATDLAIWNVSAGNTIFYQNGAERARIDSAGNVGIGTSSPANYRLHVEGANNLGTVYIHGGTGASWGLEIGSHTAGTESDLVLTDNAVVGSQASLSNVAEGTGYFRWMTGGTSHRTGTAGATEQMRLDTSGNLQFNSGYGSVATAYGCRAWVNFDGTGTVAIRNSGNVSSITDNGTGDYSVNFTTAMSDANYATVCSAADSTSTWPRLIAAGTSANSTYSVSAVGLYVVRPDTRAAEDNDRIQVAIFR